MRDLARSWYRAADCCLGRLERLGVPDFCVLCVAYLLGIEIARYLAELDA